MTTKKYRFFQMTTIVVLLFDRVSKPAFYIAAITATIVRYGLLHSILK